MDGPSRIANVSAALLLGGESTRMGRDKALLEIGGEPAAVRLAALLSSLFEDVMLVGGDPPERAHGRRVPDAEGPRCALRGLATALASAREERVLVLATDLMAMTPDLLLALVAYPEADAVVPRAGGVAQPLCAIYRRVPALSAARRSLASGRLALMSVLDQLALRWLEGDDLAAVDPDGHALRNVNTPDDYAQLAAREARA
ncbi:MAG TPA: molybdenum cofactor guanylyltransferase [Myxococcota bacterium]|nr:molybdenum cofactor guanylyltransferase [Myxococcota bacterium]